MSFFRKRYFHFLLIFSVLLSTGVFLGRDTIKKTNLSFLPKVLGQEASKAGEVLSHQGTPHWTFERDSADLDKLKVYFNEDKAVPPITVTNAGQVGIDTTVPVYAFDVKALPAAGGAVAMRLTGNRTVAGASENVQLRFAGKSGTERWAIGNAIATDDNSTTFDIWDLVAWQNRFRIDGSGNVGIGTLTPQAKLDLRGNMLVRPYATGAVGTGIIQIQDINAANAPTVTGALAQASNVLKLYSNNSPVELDAGTGGVVNASQLYLSPNTSYPFVGIGTNAPGTTLDVWGGQVRVNNGATFIAEGRPAVVQGLTMNYNQIYKHYTGAGTGRPDADDKLYLQWSCEGCGVQIGDGSGAPNNLYVFGNVGIGTAIPSAKLDIATPSTSTWGGWLNSISLNGPYPAITAPNAGLLFGLHGIDRKFYWADTINSIYAMSLTASGLLYPAGGCGNCGAPSDIRLKENIKPLEDSLNRVQNLQGVSFNYKPDNNKGLPKEKQVGLVAQDVEKVVPEVVTAGPDGYKIVDYAKLSAVLIEAVKQQQKEIDELKQQVNDLQKNH